MNRIGEPWTRRKPYSDTPLVKARLKELAKLKRKPRIMAAQDREDEKRNKGRG